MTVWAGVGTKSWEPLPELGENAEADRGEDTCDDAPGARRVRAWDWESGTPALGVAGHFPGPEVKRCPVCCNPVGWMHIGACSERCSVFLATGEYPKFDGFSEFVDVACVECGESFTVRAASDRIRCLQCMARARYARHYAKLALRGATSPKLAVVRQAQPRNAARTAVADGPTVLGDLAARVCAHCCKPYRSQRRTRYCSDEACVLDRRASCNAASARRARARRKASSGGAL